MASSPFKKIHLLKNPYYRMAAVAVVLIFGLMHWAYGLVRQGAAPGTRSAFFGAAVAAASLVVLAAVFMGERFRRRLDRLADAKARDWSGSPDEFFGLDRRVTGLSRDLENRVGELEREKTRLDAMLRNLQEGLVVIGEDRLIRLLNPAAERILGVSSNRAVGFSLLETARNSDLEALESDAFESDSGMSRQIRFFRPDERYLQVNLVPYRDSSGERQAVMIFHDMTEVHRLENLRKEFVANVSHELKTPLTSLQGFIETLQAGAWKRPEHAPRFLDMMAEDAKRLSRLIHDLLDLSKIESGAGSDKRERIDAGELIERTLPGLRAIFSQKKLDVRNETAKGLWVEADPDQLEQVFVNLLENAAKFTPEGGRIRIRCQSEPSAEGGGTLRFEVIDSGVGIPESALPRVFERFYRVDPARSREVGGTGLGLSIVKHIVEQHGGSVGVTSPGPGQGATFFFRLPAR